MTVDQVMNGDVVILFTQVYSLRPETGFNNNLNYTVASQNESQSGRGLHEQRPNRYAAP